MKNYWFYYYPNFYFINQHGEFFDYIGLDYFRYFKARVSIYRAAKTRVPAFIITFILFGYGFDFCTHDKR